MYLDTLAAIPSLVVVAVAFLAVAVITLFQLGFHERLGRALMLYAVVSGVWIGLLALWRAQLLAFLDVVFIAHLPLYGMLLVAFCGLALTQAFLRLSGERQAWWWIGGGGVGLVLLALDINLLPLGPGWASVRARFMPAAIGVVWGFFACLTLVITLIAHRRAQSALHRNRVRYWALFLALVYASDGLLFVPWLVPASLVRLVATLLVGYLALSHNLPDIRRLVQQGLGYLFVTVITTALYLAFFGVAAYTFLAAPIQPWAAWLILAGILAICLGPLRNLAQLAAQRLFIGKDINSRQMVSDYSLAISNILEIERLAELAISLINDAMGIRHGALFLVDLKVQEDGYSYFRLFNAKALGAELPTEGRLAADGQLATYLRQEHTPLTHYDIDMLPRFRDVVTEERLWINSLGMDVYVPIYAQKEWIGLLALGPKTSGDRYFDDDLLLLSVLADQTAVALKNARLVENLRQLNRTLDEVNRHLGQMDRTKSEFIDIVSHELMTPLAIIVGYNQLMLDDDGIQGNEAHKRVMEGIQKGTDRMKEIVDTMLDAAKIDTRTLQLQSHPVSISAPIREVADKLKPALVERKQTLEIKDLSTLPPLETDLEALYKVFYHLIINAIKYTPDGGRITVSGRALPPAFMPAVPDGGLEVIVADTGIGIDPQHLELIFAKFYQTGDVIAHSSGKTKFKGGGPGLGLAIVKGIIDAHGGKVWAESLGHNEETCPGSRFHIVLPLQQKYTQTA